jgi:hypothetical protein
MKNIAPIVKDAETQVAERKKVANEIAKELVGKLPGFANTNEIASTGKDAETVVLAGGTETGDGKKARIRRHERAIQDGKLLDNNVALNAVHRFQTPTGQVDHLASSQPTGTDALKNGEQIEEESVAKRIPVSPGLSAKTIKFAQKIRTKSKMNPAQKSGPGAEVDQASKKS